MLITYQLEEIDAVVKNIWNQFQGKKVWLFYAQMGSGKTTFINALCKHLQIKDVASSPTFSIINQYNSFTLGTVYHLDLYRLKDEDEAINAGVEDVIYSGEYCFIEWPKIAESLMPEDALKVEIKFVDLLTRQIEIKH